MEAVSRLAALAMQRIEEGALAEESVSDVADDLGVSPRHLRRVIKAEYGVSPIQIAQTHRLQHAKRLLTDTALPVTEIAFASGFSSLRRFNALFKERYRLVPRSFRKGRRPKAHDHIVSDLAYRPPFAWDALLAFLNQRAMPGVELVQEDAYYRTVRSADHRGYIKVEHVATKNVLRVTLSSSLLQVLVPVLARVKTLFDLRAEPARIAANPAIIDARGIRVPGAFDSFEIVLHTLLLRDASNSGKLDLIDRFSATMGETFETGVPGLSRLTPTAERIARASAKEICSCGVSSSSAKEIMKFSTAVAGRTMRSGLDLEDQIKELMNITKLTRSSAEYAAMRIQGSPDAFPHEELGISIVFQGDIPGSMDQTDRWRPWRSYAAFYFWKQMFMKTQMRFQ